MKGNFYIYWCGKNIKLETSTIAHFKLLKYCTYVVTSATSLVKNNPKFLIILAMQRPDIPIN